MTSRQPCVAVVGSLNTDLVTYLSEVPLAGQTVFGRSFATGFGGKGANQAAMASKCGARVFMVGCLGNDANGLATRAHLTELGVSIEWVASADTTSGVALIWVEDTGANRIVIVPGANAYITAEQATASVAQIDSLDVVVGQCEIPMEATISAFQAAKARSAMTVLNPAPAIDLPESFLSLVDWLVPNEHEFEMMFGSKPTPKNIAKAASQLFADRLSDSHRSASDSFGMVVTLGDKGAALWSSSAGEVEFAAAERTDAVDTTGAGDAFVGAFAVGLASGLRPNQAALAGCLCATDSVNRLGAQESFPDYEFAKQAFSAAMSV